MANIEIGGRLHSTATGNVVTGANEVFDDIQNKKQQEINAELIEAVGTGGSVYSKIAAAKEEIIGDAASDYNTLGKLEDKIQAEATRAEAVEEALDGRVDTLEEAVGTGGSVDSRISAAVATETTRAQAAEDDRYTKSETYNKTELNNMITTPNQEYVSVIATAQTTAVTDVLPATGAADTTYRVGNWDGTQYNDSVFSEYAWNGSAYIKLSTKSQVGEVYDISVNHADTKYADLKAALGTNGANIPQSLRKGGMSVKFIQSSDNKYVQYRLMSDEFTTDTTQWAIADEGVYVENPEFIYVKADAENKILWAIKTDGSIYYGAGVPQQIVDYINEKIAELSLDECEDIVTFLGNLIEGDDTLAELLNGKVDKVEGKGLSTNDYDDEAKSIVDIHKETEDFEWLEETVDNSGAFLEGIEKATGKKRYATQELFDVEEDDDYLLKIPDGNNHLAFGIRKNLQIEYEGDVPEKTKEYVSESLVNLGNNTIAQNRSLIQNIYAAAKYNVPSRYKCLQLMIIADSHNDKTSVKRAIKAANYLRSIDGILYLGDMAGWTYKDTVHGTLHDSEEMRSLLSDSIKPYYLVCGNHDVGMSRYVYYTRTHEEVYNFFIQHMVDKGFLAPGEYQTTGDWADRCYYYHDFHNTKIRLIVLYEYGMRLELDDNEYWEPVTYNASYGDMVPGTTYTYDSSNPIVLNCGAWKENSFRLKKTVTLTANPNGDQNGGTWPWYKMRNFQMFEKTQMEWLINRLNDTPDGYGIVIASHQSLLYPVDTTDYKFSIGSDPDNAYHPRNNDPGVDVHIDVPIVSKIVGAWQNKATLNERVAARDITVMGENGTYLNTETDGQGDYMYKITHDFSQRTNNNAYFSNFICGHEHCDIVERSREFTNQLEIIVTCANTKQRYMNDMPNEISTDSPAFDQLTVFSCEKNRIALCKWGCTRTVAGIDRSMEIINPNSNN